MQRTFSGFKLSIVASCAWRNGYEAPRNHRIGPRDVLQHRCKPAESPINEYSGICDASAAAPLSAETFVVANDEDNVLRVYRFGEPNVVQAFSLDQFLKPDPDEPEADIEGATRIDDQIYWVTSHGQNKNGKDRPSRHRLFRPR